jgi:hypothetical protein
MMKLHMNSRIALVGLLLITLLSTTFAEGVKKRIKFSRGHSSAIIRGAVIRGERDQYFLRARAGQQMNVRITSLEGNAVFQIYQPNRKVTLRGAGEMDDAQQWSGKLPASGDYLIIVGGTRGNATYTLKVWVR